MSSGKDDWRAYLVRTIATMLIIGGVTLVGILAVVWGGSGALARSQLESMVAEGREHKSALEKMTSGAFEGDVTFGGDLHVKTAEGTMNVSNALGTRLPIAFGQYDKSKKGPREPRFSSDESRAIRKQCDTRTPEQKGEQEDY